MNVKVTKANTFVLDKDKRYIAIINIDEAQWTDDQMNELKLRLAQVNIQVEFLPKGTKYRIMEAPSEQANT